MILQNIQWMEARPVPEEIFYSTKLAQLEDLPGKESALVIPKFSFPPPPQMLPVYLYTVK